MNSVALVIATYNWPEALGLCLQSILQQSIMPTEIIIADDGSGDATNAVILKYQKLFIIPLIHVWHEDNGFQLAQIRNKAIAKCNAEYIIQIDGDLILHPAFIADHLNVAERNRYIKGSRVLLNKSTAENCITTKNIELSFFSKGITNKLNAIHFPLLQKFSILKLKDPMKIRGCNMAFWKSDFIKINGYNEAMTGWGREDSELVMRFINLNIYGKTLKFGGIVFHLFHPENSKSQININDEILENTIEEKLSSCAKGIDQYL